MDQETLANRIMSASLNEVEEADGVYIEGAFLGASTVRVWSDCMSWVMR